MQHIARRRRHTRAQMAESGRWLSGGQSRLSADKVREVVPGVGALWGASRCGRVVKLTQAKCGTRRASGCWLESVATTMMATTRRGEMRQLPGTCVEGFKDDITWTGHTYICITHPSQVLAVPFALLTTHNLTYSEISGMDTHYTQWRRVHVSMWVCVSAWSIHKL